MFLNQILNPKPTAYSAAIAEATGAHRMQLPIIERIMREVIFHSTLDWQTKDQFDTGALEAQKEYEAARGFYEAEQKSIFYRFHLVKTSDQLAEVIAQLDRATAKGKPERLSKCQAKEEKLQEMNIKLIEQTDLWERIMHRMSQLLA